VAHYKRIKKKVNLKAPDQFVSFWHRTYNRALENRKKILPPVCGVLLLVLLAGGFFYYRAQKEQSAQRELYSILKDYPRDGAESSGKLEEVIKSLDAFSGRFSGTGAGRVGELYRAHMLFNKGEREEAARLYGEIAESGASDDLITGMAGLSLARLYQDQGKYADSAETLKKLKADGRTNFSEEVDLLTAHNHELSGEKKAAIEEYRRFLKEYPESTRIPRINEKLSTVNEPNK